MNPHLCSSVVPFRAERVASRSNVIHRSSGFLTEEPDPLGLLCRLAVFGYRLRVSSRHEDCGRRVGRDGEIPTEGAFLDFPITDEDRKSTRLNSSHEWISY